MPKVSIIMPSYNNARFIPQAIDSLFSQTYRDFEVIIVDDGSTDKTRDIVSAYSSSSKGKIKYLYQDNRGAAAARNFGMRESLGEYISFLDSDDIWLPDKLAKQVDMLDNKPGIGFVYCDNFFVNEARVEIPDYIRKISLLRGNIAIDLFCDFFIITSSIALRRKCVDKSGWFNEALLVSEDYDFFLRLANHFDCEVIEEKLWQRRVYKESLSRKDPIYNMKSDLCVLENFLKANPLFYNMHKKKVNRRMAQYYFSFGYKSLDNGMNFPAFILFLRSIRYSLSLKALKNISLCFLSYNFRKLIISSKGAVKDASRT